MNLTDAAKLTKKVAIIGGIAFVLLVIGWTAYDFWYKNYYLPNRSDAVAKADNKFGKLPYPQFPQSVVTSNELLYSIDTNDGKLPVDTLGVVTVYFIPEQSTSLAAAERARQLAVNLGFDQGPERLASTRYKFTNKAGGEMIYELNTGNFTFKKFSDKQPPRENTSEAIGNKDQLAQGFVAYLEANGLFKPGLEKGRAEVLYDKPNFNESESAVISLFPADIDKLKVVTPNFKTGLVYAGYSIRYGSNDRYTSLNYVYWEPAKDNKGIYQIKRFADAFADLKAGRGVVVLQPANNRASITSIYVAYYEPFSYSPYLQPVYVFEGPGFAAYVPAILPDFLEER